MSLSISEAVGEARVEKKKVDPRQVSMFERVESLPSAATPVAAPPPIPPPVIIRNAQPPVTVQSGAGSTSSAPFPVTVGVSQEMPMSELAQKLAEKGHTYTLQEIAQWDTAKRLRAAKFVRGETP